jgi:hypothetical protein
MFDFQIIHSLKKKKKKKEHRLTIRKHHNKLPWILGDREVLLTGKIFIIQVLMQLDQLNIRSLNFFFFFKKLFNVYL